MVVMLCFVGLCLDWRAVCVLCFRVWVWVVGIMGYSCCGGFVGAVCSGGFGIPRCGTCLGGCGLYFFANVLVCVG